MTRHYYAMFVPYGTSTKPGPYNYPTVYAFGSKHQRDQFITDHWEHCEAISAKDARKISPDQWLHVAADGQIID